jgi:hypothetical protein
MKGLKKLTLTDTSRDLLLSHFPPKFSSVHATHITIEFGDLSEQHYDLHDVKVIGYQATSYLEVLVVSINNAITRRQDKQILHITLSTLHGIPPVCSNDVLNELLYQPLTNALPLQVELQTITFN